MNKRKVNKLVEAVLKDEDYQRAYDLVSTYTNGMMKGIGRRWGLSVLSSWSTKYGSYNQLDREGKRLRDEMLADMTLTYKIPQDTLATIFKENRRLASQFNGIAQFLVDQGVAPNMH
jgi:hypothetical protein